MNVVSDVLVLLDTLSPRVYVSIVAVLLVTLLLKKGVKATMLSALSLYTKLKMFVYYLCNTTQYNQDCQAVASGRAWEEFCDSLKAAGNAVLLGPKDPLVQAEGLRYLTRLTRAGLENFVECTDVNAPTLNAIVDGQRASPIKIGADSPDNLYQNASLSGSYTYLVTGNRGTVPFLSFATQEGMYGKPGGLHTLELISSSRMSFSENGDFCFVIGASEKEKEKEKEKETVKAQKEIQKIMPKGHPMPPVHFLPGPKTNGLFIVRQTFADRRVEKPASVTIRRLHHENAPSQLNATHMVDALDSCTTLVVACAMLFTTWATKMEKNHVNALPLFDPQTSTNAGGDPNIAYYHSYYQLKSEEALVVFVPSATVPKCTWWNFQLNNHWMESLDYRYFDVHTNDYLYSKDHGTGDIVLVIARGDTASTRDTIGTTAYKVLTTRDHSRGSMCFRWCEPEGWPEKLPTVPETVVLPLLEVGKWLQSRVTS